MALDSNTAQPSSAQSEEKTGLCQAKSAEIFNISINTTPKNLFKKEKSLKKGWLEKWKQSLGAYEKLCMILYRKRIVLCKQVNKCFLYIGYMNLSGITVKKMEDPREFRIIKKDIYSIRFRAASASECSKWIAAIESAKSQLLSVTKTQKKEQDSNLFEYYKIIDKGLKTIELKLDQFDSCANLISDQFQVLKTLFEQIMKTSNDPKNPQMLNQVLSNTALFLYYALALRTTAFQFVADTQANRKKWRQILTLLMKEDTRSQIVLKEKPSEPICAEQGNSVTLPNCNTQEVSTCAPLKLQNDQEKEKISNVRLATLPNTSSNTSGCHTFGPDYPVLKYEATVRRVTIPGRPCTPKVEMWQALKNILRRNMTHCYIPIEQNEPLSYLQAINSAYEYAYLLEMGANCDDTLKQLTYIAAFVVSGYSHHPKRVTKPFIPLLGETYELDRVVDLGFRSFSECVSHNPIIIAHYCKGKNWLLRQTILLKTKFMGRLVDFIPEGLIYLDLCREGCTQLYTWNRVPPAINNVFTGDPWIDYHGTVYIKNKSNQEICTLNFLPCSHKEPFMVLGNVKDNLGSPQWVLRGKYNSMFEGAKVYQQSQENGQPQIRANIPELLWQKSSECDDTGSKYYFSTFECQLNEFEPLVATTDSRIRPDVQALEKGSYHEANRQKQALHDKQRKLIQEGETWKPIWFMLSRNRAYEHPFYQFVGKYWVCKSVQSWNTCPDIYTLK